MDEKDKLFQSIDESFSDYEFNISDADRFALVLEYQAKHLSRITDNNNKQSRIALARTSLYELDSALKRYKRNKSKNQLFKIVNLFSITCTEYAFDTWSGEEKTAWYLIESQSESILSNSKWYLRTIPESRWIIDYLSPVVPK